MGGGPDKTHEAFTVTPAAAARLADAVDARDDRPASATPLAVDTDALDAALAAVGVDVGPQTHIKVRLRAQNHPGEQGMAQKLGGDQYRVVIKVADKPAFEPRHLYVINNSLLHELRHVHQMQTDPDHAANYAAHNATVGYADNPYEVDARYYGRLADHTGQKDTGPAGTHLGKTVWGLHPG